MDFICPVCRRPLERLEKTMRCPSGHSYDISKQGYVNLLMSNKSGKKRHGDDRLMLRARRDFLSRGYYDGLISAVCSAAEKAGGRQVLDIGCGEGSYTAAIYDRLGDGAQVAGIDISADAVSMAARLRPGLRTAVASAYSLPVADGSVDTAISVFAPCDCGEAYRVLRRGGRLIRVSPMTEHLAELRAAVYDSPRANKPDKFRADGFDVESVTIIDYAADIKGNGDVRSLFMMTPYYYKTSRADQDKLAALDSLRVSVMCTLTAYVKQEG